MHWLENTSSKVCDQICILRSPSIQSIPKYICSKMGVFDLFLRLITHNYIHGTKDSETLNCYLPPNAICICLKENPFHCSEVHLQKSEKEINERCLKMSPIFFQAAFCLKIYIGEKKLGSNNLLRFTYLKRFVENL